MTESSLYERLGGVFAIAAVVDHFSDAIVETDRASLVDTTETVVAACRRLVGLATARGS